MKYLWLWVGIGGFFGSLLRWAVYLLLNNPSTSFPYSTFAVNIVGSLLIGLLAGWFIYQPSVNWQAFLITGFCGGFTTFSAFSMDNLYLIQRGQWSTALFYTAASVLLGILAAFAGFWIMKSLTGHH